MYLVNPQQQRNETRRLAGAWAEALDVLQKKQQQQAQLRASNSGVFSDVIWAMVSDGLLLLKWWLNGV